MTEYGLPFDGVLLGDAAVAPYSAAEWARGWKLRHGAGTLFPNYGVFAGTGDATHNPLEVNATAVLSSNVEVQIGAALIDGRFYETTAVVTLAINSNVSGLSRIDTILLRLDYALQTVRLAVKQGTPGGSPARPTMQQDATFWEIPLADVAVANGFTTLAQSTITQRQRTIYTQSMGWQAHAYSQTYAAGMTLGTNVNVNPATTLLIPILLNGNMLLEDVGTRFSASGSAFEWGWDLYVQDANDGNVSENTIRRIAQSAANTSGTLPGVATLSTATALSAPVPLTPGLYWLAVQNRHAVNPLPFDTGASNGFDINITRSKVTTNPNGATIDAATGWSLSSNTYCARLRGRVFGQLLVF